MTADQVKEALDKEFYPRAWDIRERPFFPHVCNFCGAKLKRRQPVIRLWGGMSFRGYACTDRAACRARVNVSNERYDALVVKHVRV